MYISMVLSCPVTSIPYSTKDSRAKTFAVFAVEPQMFSHEFQSFLALVDIVLMQM